MKSQNGKPARLCAEIAAEAMPAWVPVRSAVAEVKACAVVTARSVLVTGAVTNARKYVAKSRARNTVGHCQIGVDV